MLRTNGQETVMYDKQQHSSGSARVLGAGTAKRRRRDEKGEVAGSR
jgi:hypothetical protein